jgi:hypothetical protein
VITFFRLAVSLGVGVATLLGATSLASAAPGPATAASATSAQVDAARQASTRRVDAAGDFEAAVNFASLTTRDVGNSKCEFQVQGTLTFRGTVAGTAQGTTTALIDAPCVEALSSAPGTFRDVFRFEGDFVGTVDGVPADGELSYAGVTRPGGSIDANIRLRAGTGTATLHTVTAQLAVGGTYRGVAVTIE